MSKLHPPDCQRCQVLGVICGMIKRRKARLRMSPTHMAIDLVMAMEAGEPEFELSMMLDLARFLTKDGHRIKVRR